LSTDLYRFNQAKPKTEVEARVYEVLSHKNWGASSSLMNEIARDTFDYDRFATISMIVWESLENQRPAAWRIVFKGLTLLEHLIKNGSERCVDDARNHGHTLRALGQFNYYEGTIDRGQGVREKSKQVIEMLSDDDRIREERQKARKWEASASSGIVSVPLMARRWPTKAKSRSASLAVRHAGWPDNQRSIFHARSLPLPGLCTLHIT
jgi:hypothetical protein